MQQLYANEIGIIGAKNPPSKKLKLKKSHCMEKCKKYYRK